VRCIFCKNDSANSKSIEHIVPESLGGCDILDVGIVCDRCNNYFARKIENPFLNRIDIQLLRFYERISNKKGNVPPINAILNRRYIATIYNNAYEINDECISHIDIEQSEAIKEIISLGKVELIVPMSSDEPNDNDYITAKFLGKMAIEYFAQRIINDTYPMSIDSFIDDVHFDTLRNFVRYGIGDKWSYHKRRIYTQNKAWKDDITGVEYQILNESNFLLTDFGELYFVFMLFGVEYTLNMVWNSIDGYLDWLQQNNNQCYLIQ
jgi:hypothetical protein